MGEPLYNFDNVRDALGVLSDGDGLSLSKRRVTVSTAGVVPRLNELGAETGRFAISLHAGATNCATSWCLNKKYPIAELLQACDLSRRFQCAADHVRICDAEGNRWSPADARNWSGC